MRRARVGILAGTAVLLAATAVGVTAAVWLTPERLRAEVERRLAAALEAPVSIGAVRPSLRGGLGLDGDDVRLWTTPGGWALRAARVEVRVSPLSLLSGELRPARMTFEGATLRLERDAGGALHPFGRRAEAPHSHPDELLAPLISLESAARSLLARPRLADHVVVRDSRIVFDDAVAAARSGAPVELTLEGLSGELHHPRIRGGARLEAHAQLPDGSGSRGSLECRGSRERGGALRLALTASDLALAAAAPYVSALHPDPRVDGSVSGVVTYETAEIGSGRLAVDLVGRHLRSAFPRAAEAFPPLALERVAVRGELEIRPDRVRLRDARIEAGDLDLALAGTAQRPLQKHSVARVEATLRDVTVAHVRHLIDWLPDVRREEAASVLAPVRGGRMERLRVAGEATLAAWRAFLAGRTGAMPTDWELEALLADARVRAGDDDSIEELSGSLRWAGEHLEIRDARARLNGKPLPRLDVTIDGVGHFLDVDPARRVLHSDAEPLLGLRPLWQLLGLDDEEVSGGVRTPIELTLERLHHPMFLWPIEGVRASVTPIEHGVHIEAGGGTWGGVPVRGEAQWLFEPEESVRVRLAASEPSASPEPPAAGEDLPAELPPWARGRFAVGEVAEPTWRQRSASGSFRARGGRVAVEDLSIELAPSGQASGTAVVDLSRADALPAQLSFSVTNADVSALAAQLSLPAETATGRADLAGSFEGILRPDAPLLAGLSGLLEVRAARGEIRRALPPVVAVALASEAINPFARRKAIRYDAVETTLELSGGVMRSDAFRLEGPDVRVFASGTVDLAREPHAVDARVALYLFRQVDRVIDKIPLVNLILLGPDHSVAAAYLELAGPWAEPRARLVPLRSLASVPGGYLVDGVQEFLEAGARLFESLFGGQGSESKPPGPS